jgi:peptide subunit release factor 1 (eRF1)
LKKLLILIVISLGAWQLFFKDNATIGLSEDSSVKQFLNSGAMKTLAKAKEIAKPKATFKCDGRQHCSQMNSYEEAKYFIQHCPNTKMDGDNDGIPCERQFNR